MVDPILPNELDRAIEAITRSPAATPQLFRALVESQMALLVPFHPELAGGTLEVEIGQPLPFIGTEREGQKMVLVFSSEARARESIRNNQVSPNAYSVAVMPGERVLAVLGAAEVPALLNCGCVTGEIGLKPELMRDLASGEALKPGPDTDEEREFVAMDPADYPTELIQALFGYLKQHRSIVAAWIFTAPPGEPDAPPGTLYRIAVAMNAADEKLLDEALLVASAAKSEGDAVEMGIFGTDPETLRGLTELAPPFFVNPEFWPSALEVGF